jgi:chromosome partitioning protein
MIRASSITTGLQMRDFKGIKPSLALDLSGFTGTPKMFRDRFREASTNKHQLYSPQHMRAIRMELADIPSQLNPACGVPPIINARMTKGGVGKTTLIGNIGAALATMGYKVLMIDGDPQASLTIQYGIDWRSKSVTHISQLMKRVAAGEESGIAKAVVPQYEGGMLDLIPTDIRMDDSWLISAIAREFAFVKLLEAEKDFFSQYDVILIDSAPGISMLAATFMVASRTVLAPVEPEGQAIEALSVLESNIKEINQQLGRFGVDLNVHVLVNLFQQGRKEHNEGLSYLIAKYPGRLNNTIVRNSVSFVRETSLTDISKNAPIIEKEPNSAAARDVLSVARSLVSLYDIKLNGYASLLMRAA